MLTMIVIIDGDDRVMIERYYKELKSEMRYVAFCVLKDSSEADAAVQEAFTRIMQQIEGFKATPDKQKAGYCFTAVRNIALNMNRKAKNMRIVLAPMDSDVAAENDTLETALIRQDELALLKGKVEELEEEYRIPLVLRFADNLRYKDIAVLLDISDAAVRKRVERALDLLTAAFRKEGLLDV